MSGNEINSSSNFDKNKNYYLLEMYVPKDKSQQKYQQNVT
jgi:hypothetical protein